MRETLTPSRHDFEKTKLKMALIAAMARWDKWSSRPEPDSTSKGKWCACVTYFQKNAYIQITKKLCGLPVYFKDLFVKLVFTSGLSLGSCEFTDVLRGQYGSASVSTWWSDALGRYLVITGPILLHPPRPLDILLIIDYYCYRVSLV